MSDFFLPPHVVNEYSPILPQSQTVDWGMNVLNIPQIHANFGLRGKGVRVAIIDTGIDNNHPDLTGAVSKVINVTSEAYSFTHGHGTGCAGIIGARDNTTGVLGVAPLCEIIAIKAMRENGGGSISEIVRGIDQAVKHKAHIINMSLGTTSNVPELAQAVQRAVQAGVYVVCSAGNAGKDNSVVYPARYPTVYAIGATNQAGNVSAFSSRGWEVDVAAPGERVLTTWRNKSYARVSGTSFSAPYVSGVFALFVEAQMLINHDRLSATAIDIEEPGEDTKSGHGLINPTTFLNKFKKEEPPAEDPPAEDPPSEDPPSDEPTDSLSKVKEAYKLLGEFLNQETEDV